MDETAYLLEWLERHLRNKDLLHRKIKEIEREGKRLLVKEESREILYLVEPKLEDIDKILGALSGNEHCGVATYHTKENFAFLLMHWEQFASFKKHFRMYFVNPFSQLDRQWIIFPATQQMLSGGLSVKIGLESLAMNVEWLESEQLQKVLHDQG